MKRPETTSNPDVSSSSSRRHRFAKVLDNRKATVRGLWRRNGHFYARLTVEGEDGKKRVKWAKLTSATPAEAIAELKTLHVERRENRLRHIGQAPLLSTYIAQYLASLASGTKRLATQRKERCHLKRWSADLGHLRLDQLRPFHVTRFLDKLLREDKLHPRTRNLYLISLRLPLKRARQDGYLKVLPTDYLNWEPTETKARALCTLADIEKVCAAGMTVSKNGQQLSDFLHFLAFSGCREQEGLRVRWADVDFERKLLTVGADGSSKNREARRVNFSPALESHLKDMHVRRAPDIDWLFPSPQRGEKDIPAKSLRESLKLARVSAGSPNFGFHDCRHHFISYGVMSGIDYMTLARWAGHQDGGVLIGKVYDHLSNEHAQQQAQRFTFAPAVLPGVANS